LKNEGHAVRGLFYFCSLLSSMKKKTGFEKFHKVKSGSALKEQIRQEKKKITKERKEYFEAKRQEKYGQQSAGSNQQSGIRSSESGRKTTNYKLKTKNPGLQTAAAPQMPLNKYIAHSGVCSRRDAAELIKSGKVKLNGEVVTEPGRKVTEKDVVIVGNKKVYPVADLVYILLNKPKDYLTTTDDPQQRKTVLDLIVGATKDRVYPVGRLDRNTSGVLLLTNDGELAQKLTHPSNEIKKVYAVTLDKPLEKKHFDEILKGVALEDGMAHVDMLAYTDAQDKTQIGVEIHSGRNRIVRRIFEKFGYDVKGLDRVMFAGLTKKNVNRGRWRYLNEKEVRDLKYFKKGK
jgi:23S rRNA pseudouridine2605 synthase